MSTSMTRRVYIVHWDRTPSRSYSFHHSLLVLDDGSNDVTEESSGWTFDWGSHHLNSETKRFGKAEYLKGKQMKNRYTYAGTSDCSNEEITKTMQAAGKIFNLATNNCRDVTEKVAEIMVKEPRMVRVGGIYTGYQNVPAMYTSSKRLWTILNLVFANAGLFAAYWNIYGTNEGGDYWTRNSLERESGPGSS